MQFGVTLGPSCIRTTGGLISPHPSGPRAHSQTRGPLRCNSEGERGEPALTNWRPLANRGVAISQEVLCEWVIAPHYGYPKGKSRWLKWSSPNGCRDLSKG